MVALNKFVQEPPPDDDDTLNATNEITIAAAESDSEDDVPDYNAYQRLPLNPNDADFHDSESESEEENAHEGAHCFAPPIVNVEDSLVQDVWSNSAVSQADIQMDGDKVNEVKQAMANFTLPATSFPDWAKNIPEEQWKDHLMERLERINKNN